MKYTLSDDMVLEDVTDMIRTLAYTYECVVDSVKREGSSTFTGLAEVMIGDQIDECCRWIDAHDKQVKESHAEEISKYQKALADEVAKNHTVQE